MFSQTTLDEVLPNLFLCNIEKAKNELLLKRYGITHILSVCEMMRKRVPGIMYKLIFAHDSEEFLIRGCFKEANE